MSMKKAFMRTMCCIMFYLTVILFILGCASIVIGTIKIFSDLDMAIIIYVRGLLLYMGTGVTLFLSGLFGLVSNNKK